MMGLFGSNSQFDADVEKATSEDNLSENWNQIIEICDKVGTSPQFAKDCLKSITKRLNHQDPHVVLHAITLLEACVKNCGTAFSLEVASRDFEQELSKLLKQKNQPKISEKLRLLLKSWAEDEFANNAELSLIPALYYKLKEGGMDFNIQPDPSSKSKKDSKFIDPNKLKQEEDDLKKAIELSLKDTKQSKPQSSSGTSLYPSASNFVKPSQVPASRKVKALYDFEAAEDNELTFFAGETFDVLDDSNPNWWKGQNQRGEGLFPANFVTHDLNAQLDVPKSSKFNKKIAFNEQVSVNVYNQDASELTPDPVRSPATVEIDEIKIDRLLHLLHEADPEDASHDTEEMRNLEDQVNAMGPLIDTELETVDKEHAQLTQLSTQLVEALNMYHTLMKEPMPSGVKQPGYGYQPGPPGAMPHMYNGMGPPQHQYPPQYNMPQYNNIPYPHPGPPNQIPNSMGPMYSGMQPQHHYPPMSLPPNSQPSMSLPHNAQPPLSLPNNMNPMQPPAALPQSPPMHLTQQPHGIPNQMPHNHPIPGQMPQNHASQGQMPPQGHPVQSQMPPQGQQIPQGHQIPQQGHQMHQNHQMPQGQNIPMSHSNQLPHQHSLPQPPQSMPMMPPTHYPGPPLNTPMPHHMPQL